jgi:hypothetical protein
MAYRYEATERFWADFYALSDSQSANSRPNVLRASFSAVNGAELRQRYREGQEDQRGALGLPRRRPKNGPFATQSPITIGPIPDLVQEVVSAEATPRLWLGAPFQSLG